MANGFNLSDLAKHFSDEDAARELLESMRWPNGPVCPHCGGLNPYTLKGRADSKKPVRKGVYKCRECRKQYTVTVKTVFEDSRIPLSKWLLAIHLIASSKKGMSAHQLHRNLGISYKAAWFMAHRLRYAMMQQPMAELLSGTVEIDETYVGGRRRAHNGGRPGPHDKKKAAVVCLVERNGKARVFPVERVTSDNMQRTIRQMVAKGTHVMTDELNVYHATGMSYPHDMIRHSDKIFAMGNVHTNTVEGFFSLLKRGINGTFHHVSKGHLARYCDEFEFRWNNRKVSDGERAAILVLGAEGKRLTYEQPEGTSTDRQNPF